MRLKFRSVMLAHPDKISVGVGYSIEASVHQRSTSRTRFLSTSPLIQKSDSGFYIVDATSTGGYDYVDCWGLLSLWAYIVFFGYYFFIN